MTTLTHKTAVVIIPPQAAWPAIQEIRRKHDRKAGRWMPHITLIYPFVPVEQFDRVCVELQQPCQSIEPFHLSLTEFCSFRHRRDSHTIWLKPEPAEPLVELHAALRSRLSSAVGGTSPRPFRPHLSVGQAQGRRHCREMRDELQEGWTPLPFEVSEISLIWRDDPPQDQFQVSRTVPLRPAE